MSADARHHVRENVQSFVQFILLLQDTTAAMGATACPGRTIVPMIWETLCASRMLDFERGESGTGLRAGDGG
jgi:hypothetical protein